MARSSPSVKYTNDMLQAVEDVLRSTTIIWTLEAVKFWDKDIASAPFKVGDASFRLYLEIDQFVYLLIDGADGSYSLRFGLEMTTETTVLGHFRERVDFSKHPLKYTFLGNLDQLRILFDGIEVVRVMVTFFPEHLLHSKRPTPERLNLKDDLKEFERRHPRQGENCQGELIQITHPGTAAAWTVDISKYSEASQSSLFHLTDNSFHFQMYTDDSEVFISVDRVESGVKPSLTSFQLTVQTGAMDTLSNRFVQRFDFQANEYHECYVMDLPVLHQCLSEETNLIIVCSLFQEDNFLESSYLSANSRHGLLSLSRDLKELFLTAVDSDVTIEVDSEKIQGHKGILSARCPFFANMLKHDMTEKRSGVVKISDYATEDFKDFLLYLYTGQVEHFTINKALALYRAADEYDVPDLKASSLAASSSLREICQSIV